MLVLSRMQDEAVILGDTTTGEELITITVVEIGRGKIRLGVEAPKDIEIHRSEVWEKIREGRENDKKSE